VALDVPSRGSRQRPLLVTLATALTLVAALALAVYSVLPLFFTESRLEVYREA